MHGQTPVSQLNHVTTASNYSAPAYSVPGNTKLRKLYARENIASSNKMQASGEGRLWRCCKLCSATFHTLHHTYLLTYYRPKNIDRASAAYTIRWGHLQV